jgi:O-antigen ligase
MFSNATQQNLVVAAGWSVVAVAAVIPVSVAATSLLVALAILFGLTSGLYARYWRDWFRDPVMLTAMLLLAWLALSLFYTAVPQQEAFRVLKKYRELLLIPLLMPLLLEPRFRQWAMRAFVAAMLLTLVLSYAEAARQLLQNGALVEDPDVFKHRITQNTLLAFTAYWAWLQAERDPGRRLWWLLLIGVIAFNVFVMVSGRSGQLVFLALAALALYRRFRWKGFVIAGLLGAVLLSSAYFGSQLFRDRVAESIAGLSNYQAMDFRSSTAKRMSFYPNSLALIAERPLLGHGVGSIRKVYGDHVAGTPFPPTGNPHNEFLTVGIQAGVPAMLLLALLFIVQWRQGRHLAPEDRQLLQGMLVTMVAGSLLNSFLLDSTEGHWYALFSAMFLAAGTSYKMQDARNGNGVIDVS